MQSKTPTRVVVLVRSPIFSFRCRLNGRQAAAAVAFAAGILVPRVASNEPAPPPMRPAAVCPKPAAQEPVLEAIFHVEPVE